MKKTSKNLNTCKHLNVHQLCNSELKATSGGTIITCGMEGDLCKKLSVEIPEAQNETHKVVLG